MHSKLERRKTELIVKIANRAADKLEAPTGALAARFIGQLFADVVPDGLVEMSEEDLYGAGIGLLRFLQDRPKSETRLRVYNPTVDVHGWQSGHTVVEVLNDDMPFLVDSITGALQRLGMPVHMLMHPVISVVRGKDGLVEIGPAGAHPKKGANVSVIHVQVTQTASAEQLKRVEAEIGRAHV